MNQKQKSLGDYLRAIIREPVSLGNEFTLMTLINERSIVDKLDLRDLKMIENLCLYASVYKTLRRNPDAREKLDSNRMGSILR